MAISIDSDGRRQALGVEMANRELYELEEVPASSERRGLSGVILAVSDDHPGLKRPSPKCCPKLTGSAAMYIFYATRSTICPARLPTTV